MTTTPPRVVAVIAAWNRRDLLREALEALLAQTTALAGIVVVDNGSDDDSAAVAAATAPDAVVVRFDRNTGGAGGFAAGIAHALELRPDWIWAMDDDTIPTPSALEALLATTAALPEVAVAGSRVVWTDGRDHPMNTPRRKPFVGGREARKAERVGAMPIRSTSFVSMLVRADAVRRHGLPVVDYFLWNDDFEYSTRLLRDADGVFVPSSVVLHKTAKFGSTDADPGPRFYWEVRNKLWMLRASSSLRPAEKLLYGGSSVLRWARTVAGSSDRRALREAAVRGWRDGWRTAPRPNAEALADQTATAALIAELERR